MSETLRRSDAGRPRGKGRAVWSGCVYVATATGLICVVAKWGVPGALICAVLGAMSGAVVASSIWSDEDDGWMALRKIGRLALLTGLLAPGVIGLLAALEFTGAVIVLILAATAPACTTAVRARWLSRPTVDESSVGQMAHLSSLDDEALCLAWRRSFVQLEAARSASERLAVVEQRQKYLDELHRRHPHGLAAWLASGARASGDPLPYVAEDES